MCGWPSTSSPEELVASLRRQPLLAVLREPDPAALLGPVEQLQELGVRHLEIAWSEAPGWIEQCREIRRRHPDLLIGAASVCSSAALIAASAAGLSYAIAPVLAADLLGEAAARHITLIPGVMTPSEVAQASRLGCRLVKLFPATALGRDYWRQLAGPLGPLPFCIAAGGLRSADVPEWLEAGVDAVALGGSLFDASGGSPRLDPCLPELLAHLDRRLA